MNKPIAVIAGEPNSISSEIIFKSWKLRSNYNHRPFFVIGSYNLLFKQNKKLKFKIKFKKINNNFKISQLKGPELPIYDIQYKQKKPYEKISSKSNKYIFKCFDVALKLVKEKKICGLINCPVAKEFLFKNNHQGITEFLSTKINMKGNEVMLIFNKKLSVSPITTHIPLSDVSKKINLIKIIKKVKTINIFYNNVLGKKPKFAILGLNPHNFTPLKNSKEKLIIKNAINALSKLKINVKGPISPDTSFMMEKKNNFDVIIGMYHDQVLTPFKALFNFDAINITLGLPFLRVSPDHGVAENIMGKNVANPDSLIESIKFFNKI